MPSTDESSTTTTTADTTHTAASEPRVNRRKRKRNWYFILIRIILVISCFIILFSGFLYIWQAANALNVFGSVLSRDCISDQAFNNIWRHISVFWISFAPSCILISTNIQRFGPMLMLHCITLFAAGCVRFWTAWTYGIPGTPMGYFLVYITTFFDLTTPLVGVLLYTLGLRYQTKIDSQAQSIDTSNKEKRS